MSKNEYSLATNILGRRVLVNEKFQSDIYNIFGISKNEIEDKMEESLYFKKTFGRKLSLSDQLCLAFPLILASLEYKLLGKKEASDLCYLLAHFKPYSSRESVFFKYGVKEGQMLYTIEKSLSERFDIKKYGTIISCIQKRAKSSYDNYITPMKATDKLTDKTFYIIYTSGIAGSMNTFIGGIVDAYRKNEGKSLDFDSSTSEVFDKDDDSMDYEDADIESDASVRNNVTNKIIMAVINKPVDKKLIEVACQSVFHTATPQYVNTIYNIVMEVTDKMFDELDPFFRSLISAFLFIDNPHGGKQYGMAEFKSPIFLNVGIDILSGKKNNAKNINLVRCREIFKKMVTNHSTIDTDYGENYKRLYEKALASYWIFLIKSVT